MCDNCHKATSVSMKDSSTPVRKALLTNRAWIVVKAYTQCKSSFPLMMANILERNSMASAKRCYCNTNLPT